MNGYASSRLSVGFILRHCIYIDYIFKRYSFAAGYFMLQNIDYSHYGKMQIKLVQNQIEGCSGLVHHQIYVQEYK